MIGCFLYAKLIRDIICLVAGGGLIYSIVRWRHFIFFPLVWPFAELVKVRHFDGTIHREFEPREWAAALGGFLGGVFVSLCILLFLFVFCYVLWPALVLLYHHYVVC
jgi:hypothetical protein